MNFYDTDDSWGDSTDDYIGRAAIFLHEIPKKNLFDNGLAKQVTKRKRGNNEEVELYEDETLALNINS